MEYILSTYTHFFTTQHGEKLVYNSEMNSFFKVSSEIYHYLENLGMKKQADLNTTDKDFLVENKIIVSQSHQIDFINQLKLLNHLRIFDQSTLSLTLIPTSACNLSCPYCFEENKPLKRMSDKTINDLIKSILMHKRAERFSLTWYGGEPLLAFSTIQKILERIKKDVEIPMISHSIVTNGVLFNEEVCDFFSNNPLNSIQITIDGNKDEHNSKRFLKNNRPTFNTIISNIDLILEKLPKTHLSIRINVDENNKQSFSIMYKEFQKRWKGKNFSSYPGFIRIDNSTKTNMQFPSILGGSKKEFYQDLGKNDIGIGYYPSRSEKICSANRISSYIIGAEGEIYKCWNDVGYKEKIIGYINKSKLINQTLLAKYIVGCSPFDNPDCLDCFFFPICSTGCSAYRMKNIYENGNYDLCTVRKQAGESREFLSECLEKHYSEIIRTKQQITE